MQQSNNTISSQLPLTAPSTPNIKIQKLNNSTNSGSNNNSNSNSQNLVPLPTPTTPTPANSFFNATIMTTPSTHASLSNSVSMHSTSQKTTVLQSPPVQSGVFSWAYYLEHEKAEAVPVYAFKHVPLNEFWTKIMNGIKVEVPNCEFTAFDTSAHYWFASVIKYAGYLAKLRYIGFEDNDKYDFWVHLCDPAIHPVGWAAENDVPLIPPKELTDKCDDWKEYLINKLTGFKTLPKNFHRKVSVFKIKI